MKRIHFIAIGGSAMHNLALALQQKAYVVSGSDDEIFEPARGRLAAKGLLPDYEGWFPEKIIPELDAVILGMHAKADNPELLKAQQLRIPIFSYPEFLYEQAKDKTRIVIGGSHGKTTITAMVLHAMQSVGMDTDYMVGARLEGFDIMVRLSEQAGRMVLEGDEYLTSALDLRPKFHLYRPHIALISGIAWDHINVFPTYENYVEQFRQFIRLTEAGGIVFFCSEDKDLAALCSEPFPHVRLVPYSFPVYSIVDGKTSVSYDNQTFQLTVFGKHNLLNASGACLVWQAGIAEKDFWKAMTSFRGAANRLECLGSNDQTTIFKDFAHAPSKVSATVRAVKEQFPHRRLLACLELHTYSSLSSRFLPHYLGSLDQADIALVYYNPHALKLKRLPELNKEMIIEGFGRPDLQVFNDSVGLHDYLTSTSWGNTNVLLMSSGNFDGMNLDDL